MAGAYASCAAASLLSVFGAAIVLGRGGFSGVLVRNSRKQATQRCAVSPNRPRVRIIVKARQARKSSADGSIESAGVGGRSNVEMSKLAPESRHE